MIGAITSLDHSVGIGLATTIAKRSALPVDIDAKIIPLTLVIRDANSSRNFALVKNGKTKMKNSLSIFCPSTGNHEEAVTTWQDCMAKPWPIVVDDCTEGESAGFLTKCDKAWRESDASVIGFLHADLYVSERGWDARILAEFEDEQVAVVGFVGAKTLGTDSFGKVPYDHRQLARGQVISNLSDWEIHGARKTSSCDVAMVDSCAVFVRHSFLARIGGWPVGRYPNNPHCSDLWICLSAIRAGFRVRMVGIACTHRSGGKGEAGSRWLEQHGGDMVHHREAHALIAQDFKDILPVKIK